MPPSNVVATTVTSPAGPRPRQPRRLPAAVLIAALAVGLLAPLAGPARAERHLSGERLRTIPVWSGVERDLWRLTTSDGEPVRAQVTRIAPDAPVDLELAFGQGVLPGLETVPSMARERVDDGAVLGINGGFWRSFPFGRPDGFTVRDSRLVSEAETRGDPDVGRGAFGLAPSGEMLIDRLRPQEVQLNPEGRAAIDATGINRLDRDGTSAVPPDSDDALYVITDQFGSSVTLPTDPDPDEDGGEGAEEEGDEEEPPEEPRGPARWRTVPDLTTIPLGHGAAGTAGDGGLADPGATLPLPSHGALLVGYGASRTTVDSLGAETLTAETDLQIHNPVPGRTASRWAETELGLTAGPHIVRSGEMIGGWEAEGFGAAHNSRNPRTAVGVTGDGTVLLVTVDGRRDERSVGLSTAETASFFENLGAVEAVMLDGGGSTTLTHDTVVVNEPSDGSPNPVANGVFVQHRESFTATERLAGRGREHTAAAVARAGFPDGADEAVVAAGTDFPDALSGGPLAAVLDAPLLLANPNGVADVTLSALDNLGVARVTVLGGEAAVPPDAVDQLEAAGYRVQRVAGNTRFSTAAEISERVDDGGDGLLEDQRVVLASGLGFADALVAAAPAGMLQAPILLTAPDQLPGATETALGALGPDELVVVGGTAAVSEQVAREAGDAAGAQVTRLSGPTRFATARAINEWAEDELRADLDRVLDGGLVDDGLMVARGDRFPDALAGGPLGAARRQLLMIVPPWDVRADADAAAYLDRRSNRGLQEVTLLGGFGALTSYQQWQLEQLTSP